MVPKTDNSTEYTTGGTPANHGFMRRLNPMLFLSIGSALLLLVIVATLIVFTFLPIFSTAKGEQTKYQIRSDVLTLVYNLPDRAAMSATNWTYEKNDLEYDKLSMLQNLLQDQLNSKKLTRSTSIAIMDAFITREGSSTRNAPFVSPVTRDQNNNTMIIITQADNSTRSNATVQLVVSLRLRYALECAKKCQNNMKESIFAKTFHNLELPLDTFQTLLISSAKSTTTPLPSSSALAATTPPTTRSSCIVTTPVSTTTTPVKYEAESLSNRFLSTTIESCVECSGEQKVGKIGFANELTFRQIFSQNGGSTMVTFHYTTDRIRTAQISVNDALPARNVTFPKMFWNQQIASLPMNLNLCQGLNSIRIYNPHDYAPELDGIIVY